MRDGNDRNIRTSIWSNIATITTAALSLALLIGIAIGVWKNYFNPPPQAEVIDVLRASAYRIRSGFVDVCKEVLDIEDIHDTRLQGTGVAQKAHALAKLSHSISYIQEYIDYYNVPLDTSFENLEGLETACAMAKIYIYEAQQGNAIFYDGYKKIDIWLNRHRALAKKDEFSDYLRYNDLLRAQYYRLFMQELVNNDKDKNVHKMVEYYKKANKYLKLAGKHSKLYNRNPYWIIPLTSKYSMNESLYFKYRNNPSRHLPRFLDTLTHIVYEFTSLIDLGKIDTTVVETDKVYTMLYNAAEYSLCTGDYDGCMKLCNQANEWWMAIKNRGKYTYDVQEVELYFTFLHLTAQLLNDYCVKSLDEDTLLAAYKENLNKLESLDSTSYYNLAREVCYLMCKARLHGWENSKIAAGETIQKANSLMKAEIRYIYNDHVPKPYLLLELLSEHLSMIDTDKYGKAGYHVEFPSIQTKPVAK